LLRKKYFYGKMFGVYFATNPYEGVRHLNPFRRIFGPTLATLPTDPANGLGILILRALEFAAAGLGHLRGSFARETERRR